MRPLFLVTFLCLATLAPALGRLVQPDGSVLALGEVSSQGTRTLLLAPRDIPVRSWILFPPGAVVTDVETASRGERRQWTFPTVRIPGLRFAIEVPAQTLSLTLRGRFPATLEVVRSITPPAGPQPWVVRGRSDLRVDLPAWKSAAGWTTQLELSRPGTAAWRVTLASADHTRTFEMDPSVRKWAFSPAAWGFTPSTVVVQGQDPRLSEVRVRAIEATASLPADPPTLLAWPRATWRDGRREWFHWEGTSVLVLVTANYAIQDEYLKRLAFFIEKAGFRGRMVTDAEVSHLHAWNAHDYAGPDLARFFTKAATEGFALNASELELRNRLVTEGILVTDGAKAWKAGTGALVGVSEESGAGLKAALFVHEAFHGLYFTTPAFRVGVKGAWDSLSEPARQAFRTYLSHSRYDPTDEGLMVNEFQAYVLQRPANQWEEFFRDKVIGSKPLTAAGLTWLTEYLGAAQSLDSLVRGLFGFPSGNVSPVTAFGGT